MCVYEFIKLSSCLNQKERTEDKAAEEGPLLASSTRFTN